MKRIKEFVDYFFIGVKYIMSSKCCVIFIYCLGIYLLNTTMCLQEEVDKYENEYNSEKISTEINTYYDNRSSNKTDKSIAASDLISCINDEYEESEEIKKIKEELYNLYNSNNNYFSFIYKDIYTGYTVSYNENGTIFTASTIKAPAMIYLYEEASKGNIDLEEKLTYTSNFYSEGSGILKNKEFNTEYTVKELISYAIHYSDNVAYKILMNRYGRENIYEYWKNLGTSNIFYYDTVWGITSAKDSSIYMMELYEFYKNNDNYGEELMNLFKNAEWKQVRNINGEFNTANKGGWSESTFHDVAIVFENNPYILSIMSETGKTDYNYLFKTTSELIGKLHKAYWEAKIEKCNKIEQY